MTPHDAFLQSIIENPSDDAPRLIYADWLEENGQPERAEFIRVQCELAAMPTGPKTLALNIQTRKEGVIRGVYQGEIPHNRIRVGDVVQLVDGGYRACCFLESKTLDARRMWTEIHARPLQRDDEVSIRERRCEALRDREEELLAQFGSNDWFVDDISIPCGFRLDDVSGWNIKTAFRRGFVAEITLSCADWLKHRDALLRATPLERATLTDLPEEWFRPQETIALLRGQRFSYGGLWDRGNRSELIISFDEAPQGYYGISPILTGNPHALAPQGLINYLLR